MLFRLAKAEYDHHTERGYVEFRGNDGDGGEIVIATIVSFRSKIQTQQTATPARDCSEGSLCPKKGCGRYIKDLP